MKKTKTKEQSNSFFFKLCKRNVYIQKTISKISKPYKTKINAIYAIELIKVIMQSFAFLL